MLLLVLFVGVVAETAKPEEDRDGVFLSADILVDDAAPRPMGIRILPPSCSLERGLGLLLAFLFADGRRSSSTSEDFV